LHGLVIKTDTCCPNTETEHKNTKTPISYEPIPIFLSRDDESSTNDDEYDEIKNDTEVPPPSHPLDEISYSTLGSPIDATPITPRPIPDEIEFQLLSCLKNNQYASIQRDDIYPLILNKRQILTATYIANLFEPTPLDILSDVQSYDTFTNIDGWLSQQGYDELVGKPVRRTPSELRNMEEERFLEILETHTDANDPILSTKIDLRRILFSNQQYHLTEEEKALPPQLLHKEDRTV
jgi:hypothetical protein